MKYCEEYAALLDAYFDGECTPEEAEQVRAHIAVCPGCRAYLNELALLRDAFPDGEDTEVPEGFADGVMAAIAGTPNAGKSTLLNRVRLLRPAARRMASSATRGRPRITRGWRRRAKRTKSTVESPS